MMQARPSSRPQDMPSRAVLLGFVEDDHDRSHTEQRLAQVAASAPLAAATMTLAVLGACWAARFDAAALGLAVVIALAMAGLMLCAGPRLAGLPPHRRTCGGAAAAALLAAAALSLLWIAAAHGPGMASLGATVFLAGAIGMAGLAIHPVRGMMLGFGVGLVVAMAAMVGAALVWFEALALLAALTMTTLRLSRLDRARAIEQAERAGKTRLATKMMAEFEEHGAGWFWEADRDGRITYISAHVADEIAEHDPPPPGRMLTDIFRMDGTMPGTERTLAFHLSSRTSFADYPVRATGDADGVRWWSISGRPLMDELEGFQGFIGTGADLSRQRRAEAAITRLALFDELTGLANRQRMRLSLDRTLAQAAGDRRAVALFLLDLDRFKAVNDTLGHQAGDALLRQVAQRLAEGVGAAGLIGRLGGDEFEILLPGIDGREALATLADDLIAALSRPYRVTGTTVTIGCSIGIALAPQDGADAETLVHRADLALYAAKADGRGVHRFYSEDLLAVARERQQLETDLRAALGAGQFHLRYQPVVAAADATVTGYEALVRWQHPVRGLVSPLDFIRVAEECGLIESIGEWVLRTACEEAARWPHGVRVAVNISPIQFANPQLPGLVANALARSGLAPDRLELEITERVFLAGSPDPDRVFRALKGLGVRLALDDFGTGHASLGYLRTAPFDRIKFDRSFIRDGAGSGRRHAAIVGAVVMLADTLGMDTTAEGIETPDEIDEARAFGCSHIQGYVYGHPVPAAAVAAALGIDPRAAPVAGWMERAPRTRLRRAARVTIAGRVADVRLRDVSVTGAMVDGLDADRLVANGDPVGLDLLIELVEHQLIPAQVRWVDRGSVGLRFAEPIDLSMLTAPGIAAAIRRTG